MRDEDVVVAPVLTEKSNRLRTEYNRFVFRVHPDANKRMIKDSPESQFGVKIDKIAIIKVREKPKRNRKYRATYKPGWKKALVKLKPGKTFDFYEGV